MMTATQLEVFKFIHASMEANGKPPTYRHIAKKMNLDLHSAFRTVERIIERGFLCRIQGRRYRQLAIRRFVRRPITTLEFDYFALDYSKLGANGWPLLVPVGLE